MRRGFAKLKAQCCDFGGLIKRDFQDEYSQEKGEKQLVKRIVKWDVGNG